MSACAPGSEAVRRLMAALGLALCAAFPASAEAPARVVSMNLCTDQLALLIF